MGISAQQIREGVGALRVIEPRFDDAFARVGYPEPRVRERGYRTLLRTIVGQKVSVAAAGAVWSKLVAAFGEELAPDEILAAEFDALRACGLSRQKQGYARSLCEMVGSGELDFATLPEDDDAAIALLTRIKGIGRWSAEIYLLFAEGRPDIWPAGDLGVQAGLQQVLGLADRPGEVEVRKLAEPWRPHRGAATLFVWHCYGNPAL